MPKKLEEIGCLGLWGKPVQEGPMQKARIPYLHMYILDIYIYVIYYICSSSYMHDVFHIISVIKRNAVLEGFRGSIP